MALFPPILLKTVVPLVSAKLGSEGSLVDLARVRPVGTAFLVAVGQKTFLVTCRHIAERATDLVVVMPSLDGRGIWSPLAKYQELMGTDWTLHPESSDVAVTPWGWDKDKIDLAGLADDFLLPSSLLRAGDEVAFIGYPMGFGLGGKPIPLLRGGFVSFVGGSDRILLDAEVLGGNSGSPLFKKPAAVDFDDRGNTVMRAVGLPKIAGIITGYQTLKTYLQKAEEIDSDETGRIKLSLHLGIAAGAERVRETLDIAVKKLPQT